MVQSGLVMPRKDVLSLGTGIGVHGQRVEEDIAGNVTTIVKIGRSPCAQKGQSGSVNSITFLGPVPITSALFKSIVAAEAVPEQNTMVASKARVSRKR
jgi:hypothetical protein